MMVQPFYMQYGRAWVGKYEDVCDCNVIHQEIVEQVRTEMPDEDSTVAVISRLKVVADRTRLRIMLALNVHELCVCDLAVLLGMTKSAISHQLRVLRKASLVKFRRDGKVVYYSLSDQSISHVLGLILSIDTMMY